MKYASFSCLLAAFFEEAKCAKAGASSCSSSFELTRRHVAELMQQSV